MFNAKFANIIYLPHARDSEHLKVYLKLKTCSNDLYFLYLKFLF